MFYYKIFVLRFIYFTICLSLINCVYRVYILPYGPDYTKAVGKLNPLIKFSDCKVTNININMVHTMQTFNNFYSDFVFYAIV